MLYEVLQCCRARGVAQECYRSISARAFYDGKVADAELRVFFYNIYPNPHGRGLPLRGRKRNLTGGSVDVILWAIGRYFGGWLVLTGVHKRPERTSVEMRAV